jgi:hypothetical protein
MTILERNLAALQKINPALAQEVAACQPGPNYLLLQTKTRYPTLAIHDDSSNPVTLYSKYDPMKEAEREIQAINHTRIYVPVFAGIGLGYSLRYLWDHYRRNFTELAILERDIHIFRLALETTLMADIFAEARIHLYVGEDLAHWHPIVNAITPGVMSSTLQLIPHISCRTIHTQFYRAALDIVSHKIHQSKAEFYFMIQCGAQIQENIWRNLPGISRAYGLNDVRGCLKDKPAIVVAAGPSLDKNVHLLKEAQNRYPIICVDTAIRTLQKNGIEPDIVVSADPNPINSKHFIDTHARPETILAYNPELFYSITQQWPYRHLFINLDKEEFTRWLEREIGPYGISEKGGSVGHTAFLLAEAMQADPIILIGLDLAFDPKGGATHTSHAVLKREHKEIPSGASTAPLGKMQNLAGKQEHLVWVPGVDGHLVPTSQIMVIFIQQFKEIIAQHQGRVIDATQGGAMIDGTTILPLHEALRQFPGGTYRLLPSDEYDRPRDREKLHREIVRIEAALQKGAEAALQGLRLCEQLRTRVNEGAALRDTPEWQELNDCFNAIYLEEDIKIALGQALFSAIYQFIQKEFPHEVMPRLQKYAVFFTTFGQIQPHFLKVIALVKQQIQSVLEK